MRMMTMKKYFRLGIAVVLAAAVVLAFSKMASAQQLEYIISSDQQSFGETFTSSTSGVVTYSKSFFNPGQMIYVTFNAQGDTHGGAALEMACHYNGVPCELGSGAAEGGQWSTLNKLPAAGSGTSNCNSGGGGAGDCHDNTIHKIWCVKAGPGPATVDLTPGMKGRILCFFGENDGYIPRQQVEQIKQALAAARVRHGVTVYPRVGHGFFCDERPDYDPTSAADAWRQVTELFRDELDQV